MGLDLSSRMTEVDRFARRKRLNWMEYDLVALTVLDRFDFRLDRLSNILRPGITIK